MHKMGSRGDEGQGMAQGCEESPGQASGKMGSSYGILDTGENN